MDRLKRRNDVIRRNNDLTVSSDVTQVASPYRIRQQIESLYRPTVDVRETVARLRKEREDEEYRRSVELLERERIENNKKYYQRKLEEKQKQYEQEKEAQLKYAQEEEEKKDQLYEKNYNEWLDDVTKNPDKYNFHTRAIVRAAMNSYKHPKDLLAYKNRAFARALFGIKNMAGSVALSSIDTNGSSIAGKISLLQHEQDALRYHQHALDLQLAKQELESERDGIMLQYGIRNTENTPYVTNAKYEKRLRELDSSIKNIDAQLNDPTLKQFDDDYKRSYVAKKAGFWDTVGMAYRNYVSSLTYDQYKDEIAKRDLLRDLDQYNQTLVNEQYKDNKENRGGTGYRTPDVTRRDLATYTPAELLNLDVQKTQKRAADIEEERKAYEREYKENRDHLYDSMKYWEVSEYYKHGVNAHQHDPLYYLSYWGYEVPTMLGSTFSSPYQAASTALLGVSMLGYASAPWTGGIGAAIGAAAGVGSAYPAYKSGIAENLAESEDKRFKNYKELLSQPQTKKWEQTLSELKNRSKLYWKHQGKDEKWINEYVDGNQGEQHVVNDYFTGLTKNLVDENGKGYVNGELYKNPLSDPDVANAELYSTQGLQALFEADNMRTMVGNIFLTIVSVIPTGSIRKAASLYADRIGARIAEEAGETVAAGKAAREIYANGFRRKSLSLSIATGFSRGAAVGEMSGFGFAGEIIGGTAGAMANVAGRLGISKLSPSARNLYRTIEQLALHKYQNIYDKLLPNSKFGKAVAIYGGRALKNTSASAMSETAEEAVQYLNSNEDYASKYGWNGMSFIDAIANDIYQGARVFNSYGALLGLTNSELLNDAEYWANAKGGFALGGLHTGAIRVGMEGFNAYREIPTHEAILTSSIMNRELDAKDRASNVEFARQAMRKRTAETLSVLDWMEKNDSRRETPFFTQEDYDDKRKAATRISLMVNDNTIRQQMEAKGIVYGTEMYANAIADMYSLESQKLQNVKEAKEKENNIQKFYNSPEYLKEVDGIVEQLMSQSFESFMGTQAAVIKAGNEAVAEEISKKRSEGADETQIESPEFKKHLEDIRKEAQDVAQRNASIANRNKIITLSHAAHKLQSLLKLRSQYKSINDFFTFLSSKFNLKPKRPDAKLIVQSIDRQIKDVKSVLKQADENFNENLSDDAILKYIEDLPIVRSNSDEIEQHEIAAAMIEADREVIDRHIQSVEYGLVKNKEGKWEYNPAAYNAKRNKAKRLNQELRSGKINFEEFVQQMQEEEDVPTANAEDVKENPYKLRIQAIMDARRDNSALNWMANDIENGDGVTKILETLAQEEERTANSENTKAQAKAESETLDIEKNDEPVVPLEEVISTPQETPKEKYERRAEKSRKRYNERKKSLRDLRKNLRNRTNAVIVPIPTPLLDFANYIIHKAELGTYKIAQFAEDMKQAAQRQGTDANGFLSGIKSFYMDNVMALAASNQDVLENISSAQEVVSFNFGTDIAFTQPTVFNTPQEMLDLINAETKKINKTLSTHFDTIVNEGENVVVYPNKEAIVNAKFGEQHVIWKWVVEKLTQANTSDESFRSALSEIFENYQDIPVEEYTKYRNVDGIILAIANLRSDTENQESIQNGKRIRNAVVSILLDREDLIDPTYFIGDYDQFRNQVLAFKQQLTSTKNGKGLTILDTFATIYGLDKNGQRISSEADVIATDGEKMYVIDVRYSFDSIRSNWNTKYPKATFTIGEHVTRRVKQIEQIINSKFNRGVNGLYCFPVVYNPSDKIFYVEESNGNFLIEIKPETLDEHDGTIESYKESVQNLVAEINKNVDEYNIVAEEAQKYSDLYNRVTPAVIQEFSSILEYVDYLNQLHATYDNLVDRIDEMRQLINRENNIYEEVLESEINNTSSETQPVDFQVLLDRLHTACQELDLMLDEIPNLKPTTQREKDNIQKLIDTVFEAQLSLDDVLLNENTQNTDVTKEEELIAVALEKMAENKQVFGESSTFVRNWWTILFVVGPSQNMSSSVTSITDQYFSYINRIDSWTNTLRDHVLSKLEGNLPLQEWYSTVLNNYFSKLLDNAQTFSDQNLTDYVLKQRLLQSIQNGRSLIEEFNGVWDTRPEEGFDGPVTSPADIVNRMPVKWKDLYGTTTSVMPSFDQMRNPIYYYLSISPTFLDSKFKLSQRRDGTLQLYIEGFSADGSSRNVTLTFENDLTKAGPKDVERWRYVNNARQRWIRKAIAALNFVKEHPEYEIRFDKFTNKGRIEYDEDGKLSPVTDWLFSNSNNQHDLYTIKLSKKDRVGIMVRLDNNETGMHTYNVRGGDNMLDDIGGFDRDFLKQKVHTQSGAIVYYYDTGNGLYIGTPIESTNIGQEDAAKLVYLMEKYLRGDRTDEYGFDIYELLNLRLYMATPDRNITRYNNVGNMISLDREQVTIGDQTYDIVSLKLELISRIASMNNVTRGTMMNTSMRTSNNSVIARVRTLFGQSSQQKMQLTNGLVFDKEDFTHHNTEPGSQDGSTWFGYMLRNGLLGSSAKRLGYKELRLDNLRVVLKNSEEQPTIRKELQQAEQQRPKINVRTEDIFDRLSKLRMTVNESEIDVNRGSEEQESFVNSVTEYFNNVLGTTAGTLSFIDEKFLKSISKNERVIGICTSEGIKLSKYAPLSAAWHEAFHKIFELAIPAKDRDALYDAYKNRWWRKLITKPTDREVAEAFADMFVTYMQNKNALNNADSFYKKAKSWIKTFGFNIGMMLSIGKKNAENIYTMYNDINKGAYKDSIITKEQNERFERLFGEGLYYTVTNTDTNVSANFSHLANIGDRDKLVRGLSYYILRAYGIDKLDPNVARVKITGGTKDDKSTLDKLAEIEDGAIVDYLKSIHPVFEEVFEKVEKEFTTDDGKTIKRNYYPKFDALSRHIANYISTLFDTMRKPKIEEDDSDNTSENQTDTGENQDFMSKDTDHWDKAAYYFSKLDGLMDEVKLFFGTIPYGKYEDTLMPDGTVERNVVIDYGRNKFGCPEFMPIDETWNVIVNECATASSIEELDKMLEKLSGRKEVYAQIYQKYHKLIQGIYKYNEDGKIIVALTNFDKESFALQILSAIESQKMTYLVALSSKQKEVDGEGKSTRIVESSMDRDSKSYAEQWNRYLISGQIGVFERERGEGLVVDSQGRKKKTVLLFRNGMGGKNGQDIFSRTAKFFEDLRTALLGSNSEIEVDGVKYNKIVFDDANRIKDHIVNKLNAIGIMFERDAMDHMLAELYGGVDIDAITRFLNDSPVSTDPLIIEDAKKSTITSFINTLNQYVSNSGILNLKLVEESGYQKIGFVNKLATWEGKYRRTHSLNMALALNGKKLYSISQNNTISHIIKALNSSDLNNETIDVLSHFDYNVYNDEMGLPIGSIILKAIKNRQPLNIKGYTYIGFKTDNRNDSGSEYVEESTVEDYIAKLTMLQLGYLIFPTLSDKSTWMLMDGVPIPGMTFIESENDSGDKQTIVNNAPVVKVFGGKAYLVPNDRVLDLMIEYAKGELRGIQQCMDDLGMELYPEIPGYSKPRRQVPITDDLKILNYHTKNKSVEPNGTRFLSLTKIVVNEYNPQTKKYELKTYNLNDPRESSVNLLKLANEKFFAQRKDETPEQMIERQRETMALTLAILTQHGIDAAVNLGIISKIGYSFKSGSITKEIKATDESLMNLDTKDLNLQQIDAIARHIMRTTSYRNSNLKWKDITDQTERAFYAKMARSLAIAAIIQDATNRHIICSQEVQRCFSGHPALFKVKYNSTGIEDSAYDIQKRIGGLVSTGEDNILSLPGIPEEYTCAECVDYEVGSSANIADRLEDMFGISHAKFIVSLKMKDSVSAETIYNMSIDELKEKYPEITQAALLEGKKYAKSFTGGINVADGAAYITADMCRDMLRMRGAYNNKTRKAFKILMSSSKYDWVKSAEAFKTVYEAINVVPTKYTAYGFRRHIQNDSQVSNVAVAYYNKFALFPIFPGMAAGKMEGVYQKMLDEKVDMLLMTSAVKVGSQGAVEFDGNSISKPFNKYKQNYAYLRRQLNTDPKEKDTNAIGTQMMKIGLANLNVERTYTDLEGTEISGKKVLDELMGSVNELAKIGAQELEDMFMDKQENRDEKGNLVSVNSTINYEKVSDYLKDELTQRNANKTLILSIQTVVDPVTKKKKLACPLAATTDAAWIESIFISTMNKKIVDITTPGKSFILRSVFAMDGESKLAQTINDGKKLQMINEDHSMDCVVSIDYFRDILPKGLSFEQARQWLIDQGVISGYRINDEDMSREWHNAEATIIGYRIPTQAQSSIHALRVVDVIQAAKDTIVLPEEFTKITGSDFDIDHLYLASFNFKTGENGQLTRHFEPDTKEYYQNKILESLMILLKDTENSLNSLYKPVDNDTELVTNVSDYIPESGSTKGDPYNFGTLHEQVVRKNDYITGKKGIAPFALNSTGHMLGKIYHIKFNGTKLVNSTRLKYFDNALDKDDNVIASWLSGFINAHVDIVKDPYISRLNVNQFTYNMLNLMIRCGWGDTSLWFLANPVIRSMSQANDFANSQYMRRASQVKSGKSYRELIILDSLKEYLDENEISEHVLNDLLTNRYKSDERIRIVNWLDQNKDKLKEAAISGKVDHETAKNVFYAWKILEKYALALSSLVQHTKVDTRKYGKNFISVQKYYREYNDIFYPDDPRTSIWDVSSLRRMDDHSWIRTKTDLVSQLPIKIFGGLTFNANQRFVKGVINFAKRLEYDGRVLYQDDVVELSKHLQTAIKSRYFSTYAREVLGMSDKDIADLFTGYKSINRQLVSLKYLISNDERYARLADNPFLNQIYSMLEDKPVFANGREMSDRPGFVTVLDNVDDSKLNSDLLSEGWLDLMNDEDPRVSKFAKKFVVYAFFSSGEFKGWNKMLKYVPFEWISGEVDPQHQSYSEFIEKQLQFVSENYSALYDDVVANNFTDYRFAKQTYVVNEDGSRNFLNNDRGVKIGKGVAADQVEDVAEYVSIKKPNFRSWEQAGYELYKRIALVTIGKLTYPVYAKIKKRGYHTRGNDIYEYDWDFNYAENENKGSDTFDYEAALQRVKEFIKTGELDGFSDANVRAINKVFVSAEPVAPQPTAPKYQVEDGAHIATRGYKKGDPQKHPNFNYVFTENAQAYIAAGLDAGQLRLIPQKHINNLGVPTDREHVKLNVSDVNGTNQAGIRTDEQGNITRNAYGIVVKKFLQTADGKFVAQDGVFKDTDEDFEMFKDLNEDMFASLEQSPNKVIIFPQQMALGKAALPKRFAEWLLTLLADRFNVISKVKENSKEGYSGYGLEIKEVGVEYDWKYEEDSTYSGALEELGLPEKVRMNGGMTYRPHYDFGRLYLTENEREFVEEHINIVDLNGDVIDINADNLDNMIKTISSLYDRMIDSANEFVDVSYREWKLILLVDGDFEMFITKGVIEDLGDWSGFSYENLIGEYNKNTKMIRINKNFYDIVKILLNNVDVIKHLSSLLNDPNYYAVAHLLLNYNNLYDAVLAINTDAEDFYYSNTYPGNLLLSYSYSDKRQQELFSDEDVDYKYMNHCK